MKMRYIFGLAVSALLATGSSITPVLAHGGGLNAEGCHSNRKTGDYHCHRGGSPGGSPEKPSDDGAFANCNAARNAGAAPVRRGDPGYGSHLDRDNDGIGCE